MKKCIGCLWILVVILLLTGCSLPQALSENIPFLNPRRETIAADSGQGKGDQKETDQPESNQEEADQEEYPFEMTMLDVGQGLAVLIRCEDRYMIYDGGGRQSSSYVVSFLKSRGITTLDYMVASHYDEDHIAGLIGILNTTKVEKILTPDYQGDTQIYQSFRAKVEDKEPEELHPLMGDSYAWNDAKLEILGPETYEYMNENDRSIVLKVSYGTFSCLITGDAEYEAELDMLDQEIDRLDTDLYVAGHHGSSSSGHEDFVKAMSPTYAWISVGADNMYGHPTEKTLSILKDCQIFRTDRQGEVTAYSNGENVWFNTEPYDPLNDPVRQEEKNTGENTDKSISTYVLNTRSMKFHRPDCDSVSKMSIHNRKDYNGNREDLIRQGYEPCGNCNP